MSLKTYIVDDEKLAINLLQEYISEFDDLELIGSSQNGNEAIVEINSKKPDILFLDIHMPEKNGFDVLEALDYEPWVVFTTAYDQYAVKAFEKNAVDYVLKPINSERFKQAVDKAIERSGTETQDYMKLLNEIKGAKTEYPDYLFVQKSDKVVRVPTEDISHLEASGDYTIISASDGQFVSSYGISKLEEKLNPDIFFRIHRSTIINLNYLQEIEKHFNGGLVVKLKNNKVFPVSRTYAKKIREKMV